MFGIVLYVGMWLFFALLFWKFNRETVPGCKKSMLNSFGDAFILSITSETTIGYGNYSVESECLPGIIVLALEVRLASDKTHT